MRRRDMAGRVTKIAAETSSNFSVRCSPCARFLQHVTTGCGCGGCCCGCLAAAAKEAVAAAVEAAVFWAAAAVAAAQRQQRLTGFRPSQGKLRPTAVPPH